MRNWMQSISATTILCFVMVVILGGCSHPLEIKNMSAYQSLGVTSFDKPVKIGIATDSSEAEKKALLNGVANSLGYYTAQVIMPYQQNSQREVDVVAQIDIDSVHDGSGWNFLVNFPGFLLFAPAWNGYIYEVKYTVNCVLTNGKTKERIDQFSIPIALDIRHAAINRTWTEVSWFEFGIIAFIGGLVFISYDDNVTPLVSEKVENPLGKYIAQEIVKRVNAYGGITQIKLLDKEIQLALPGILTRLPRG